MASKYLIHIKIIICILILAGAELPASAMDDNMDVLFPYVYDELNWDDQYFYSAIIEMDDDFFSDMPNKKAAEISASFGKHNLSLAYYGDDSNKEKSIQDLSNDHIANELPLNTEDNRSYFDLLYQFDLISMENHFAGISMGLIGKMKFTEDIFKNEKLEMNLLDENDDHYFLPGIKLGFGFHEQNLIFNLIGAGMEKSDQTLFQGQAIFSFKPTSYLNIQGGYRILYIDLNIDGQKTSSDTYLGITLNF